jgi:hypothetical protein
MAFDYLRMRKQAITTELSKEYKITRQDVKSFVPA